MFVRVLLAVSGFGRERDTPVRAWYAVALVTGALVCVAGARATALLLPQGRRVWLRRLRPDTVRRARITWASSGRECVSTSSKPVSASSER